VGTPDAYILNLLDVLVENGSSAAFRMRDDFVTPATASPPWSIQGVGDFAEAGDNPFSNCRRIVAYQKEIFCSLLHCWTAVHPQTSLSTKQQWPR